MVLNFEFFGGQIKILSIDYTTIYYSIIISPLSFVKKIKNKQDLQIILLVKMGII
jgi:hypothetical protein